MINKKYISAQLILLAIALISGYFIDVTSYLYFCISALFLAIISFIFYLISTYSVKFNKDHFFLIAISTAFIFKVIMATLFFAIIKKQYYFTKPWAAYYFVFYIIFSFVASIFISQKPTIKFQK